MWVLQCCCINVKGFPHPSPHPKPQSPQSKPKGVCGCYSAAVSIVKFPHPSPHPKPQSPPSLSLKVCVCGCYSAAVSMSRPSPTPVPTLNPSRPSLSLKVCVGATWKLIESPENAVRGSRKYACVWKWPQGFVSVFEMTPWSCLEMTLGFLGPEMLSLAVKTEFTVVCVWKWPSKCVWKWPPCLKDGELPFGWWYTFSLNKWWNSGNQAQCKTVAKDFQGAEFTLLYGYLLSQLRTAPANDVIGWWII